MKLCKEKNYKKQTKKFLQFVEDRKLRRWRNNQYLKKVKLLFGTASSSLYSLNAPPMTGASEDHKT